MNDFIFHNPTKVYFGDHIDKLGEELQKYGKNVLVVYGGGSIKKNGLYDRVMKLLSDGGFDVSELSGVEPNPRHTTCNKGAQICREKNIDVLLAIGGGSTIDCTKGISATAASDKDDVWEIIKEGKPAEKGLPIFTILTNAATGSEMDMWAVISNIETNEKESLCGLDLQPKVSFEDPKYTFTLPEYQTACGAFDIFNHVIDNYYLAGDATFDMILNFQEDVMKTVVKYAPAAMKEPENYEARANLMWASSMALNGILDAGTVHSPACHMMEHEVSAYYDITHGHGLAIITPRWLTYILDDSTAPAIYRFGQKVFDVVSGMSDMDGAKKSIEALSDFCFKTLGLASTFTELGIGREHLHDMAVHSCHGDKLYGLKTLTPEDVEKIYEMCM